MPQNNVDLVNILFPADMTNVTTVANDDHILVTGGRKITTLNLKAQIVDDTNLTTTTNSTTATIVSSTGTDAIIPAATTSLAGVMTAADKTKLNGIDGSETKVNAGTNVTVTGAGTIASPYVINSAASGGSSYLWYSVGLDNIAIYATANPTGWITEPNAQQYLITVPSGQSLDRIAYVSEVDVNRNSMTNQTVFTINTSSKASTNTTMLNSFTPTISMNTQTGNVVPVGIGGSPSVIMGAPTAGSRTITIQGNTGIQEGATRIQINNLFV